MKLTKQQIKIQNQCEEILSKDTLSYEEKYFILENWHEGATNINSSAGAFFTPPGLARDFSLELWDGKTLDLCAGIGCLSFHAFHYKGVKDITCVEINPDYIRVGKKVLPEANWIQGSALDYDLITSLGRFEQVISNPPFGNIKAAVKKGWLKYNNSDFELKIIEVASKIADHGIFILPQMSTPFRYSGERFLTTEHSDKSKRFEELTGLKFEMNCGIDTSCYKDEWKGVSPICEIVLFDFNAEQELPPVTLKQSWIQLLGEKAEDMPDDVRRKRWEEWKRLASEAGDNAMVEYWSKDHIEETCSGCIHRDGDWCNYAQLPCNVNPILTIKEGIIGMACCGTGKEISENIQLQLF